MNELILVVVVAVLFVGWSYKKIQLKFLRELENTTLELEKRKKEYCEHFEQEIVLKYAEKEERFYREGMSLKKESERLTLESQKLKDNQQNLAAERQQLISNFDNKKKELDEKLASEQKNFKHKEQQLKNEIEYLRDCISIGLMSHNAKEEMFKEELRSGLKQRDRLRDDKLKIIAYLEQMRFRYPDGSEMTYKNLQQRSKEYDKQNC